MFPLHPTLDFSEYIRRRTEDFTGRDWVFQRIGDWLAGPGDPLFLITGGPGAGKSALAARLAQIAAGDAPSPHPEVREGFLAFAQFCQTRADPTLDPRELVVSLARNVAARHPVFAARLVDQGAGDVTINTTVDVAGDVDGALTAVSIGTLNIGDLSARVAFNRLVRRPLEEARDQGMTERVVILIDGLDESLPYSRSETIVRLLEDVVDDLPEGVRVIATSRPDDRVLSRLGPAALDVLESAPGDNDDVAAYLREALSGHPESTDELITTIAQAADGNFLYARHVAEAVRDGRLDPAQAGWSLPADLEEIYRDFCDRRIEVDAELWSRTFRPLLSALAVAQEPGLLRTHLRRVAGGSRAEVDDALGALSQFLVADDDEGPFGLYHTSFRDFLLAEKVDAGEANEQLARLFLEAYRGAWDTCTDTYGLEWTPHHLERAVDGGDPVRDHELTGELVGLVTDAAYQKQMIAETGELTTLRRALERAVKVAAEDRRPDASILTARGALAVARFEAVHLRPEGLFDLARGGELDRALDRFDLFACDDAWRKAVRLALIWAAAAGGHPITARARSILEDITAGEGEDELKQWVRRVSGDEYEFGALPEPPDPAVVDAILQRRGGTMDAEGVSEVLGRGPNAEVLMVSGLSGMGDEAPLYLAEADAPVLVAAAEADAALFTPRLLDYISLHAENRYAFYRNRSLWVILLTALKSRNDTWARDLAERLCLAALSGGGAAFTETLPLVVETSASADAQRLQGIVQAIGEDLDQGRRDPWSHALRRLGAVGEVATRVVEDPALVADAFHLAPRLPHGYAGFRAPALCSLAGSAEVAAQPSSEVDGILDGALDSAQNIQDPYFCLETTARVNALRRRWYPLPGPVTEVVEAFLDPERPPPHQLHLVGEDFGRRQGGPQKVELGSATRDARSLREIGRIFWKTPEELLEANPWAPSDPDQPLPEGSELDVPDLDFRPWIAARLSAAVASDPGLAPSEKARWIRRLVPAAAHDPSSLDVVLARMIAVGGLDPAAVRKALAPFLEAPRGDPPDTQGMYTMVFPPG